MVNEILKYAKGLNASTEVTDWIETTLASRAKKQGLVPPDAEHVVDYLISEAAPTRLRRMSYVEAVTSAMKWSASQQKKGKHILETETDVDTMHDFLDGTKIVKLLTENAYKREGFFMAHCVGGYNPSTSTIYSYRDKKNLPHATFEVSYDGKEITQIKGKGNGAIHPNYVQPILEFLNTIGINIRPKDMSNLGYHHVTKGTLDLLGMFLDTKGRPAPVVAIRGEKYVYAQNS